MFDSAISKPLLLIFDTCVSQGVFPDGWKNATNQYQKKYQFMKKQQAIYKLWLICFFIVIFRKDIWKTNI